MHWDTFKRDNYSTVGGDGGSRVGEVRAGTQIQMSLKFTTYTGNFQMISIYNVAVRFGYGHVFDILPNVSFSSAGCYFCWHVIQTVFKTGN